MATALNRPTWVLLSPNENLPAVSEVSALLGSIVQDFERPLGAYEPEDVGNILATFPDCLLIEDEAFSLAVGKVAEGGAKARIGDLFDFSFRNQRTGEQARESQHVVTYRLRQHKKLFKAVRALHEPALLELIRDAPPRNRGAVFMVVGLKVAVNMKSTDKMSVKRETTLKTGLPVNETLLAQTGIVSPVDLNVSFGVESKKEKHVATTVVASGERIFALQYRLIRKNRDWWDFVRPKRLLHADVGDYHTVDQEQGMYSGPSDRELANDTESEDEVEESDEGEAPDTEVKKDIPELGALDFTTELPSMRNGESILVAF